MSHTILLQELFSGAEMNQVLVFAKDQLSATYLCQEMVQYLPSLDPKRPGSFTQAPRSLSLLFSTPSSNTLLQIKDPICQDETNVMHRQVGLHRDDVGKEW